MDQQAAPVPSKSRSKGKKRKPAAAAKHLAPLEGPGAIPRMPVASSDHVSANKKRKSVSRIPDLSEHSEDEFELSSVLSDYDANGRKIKNDK